MGYHDKRPNNDLSLPIPNFATMDCRLAVLRESAFETTRSTLAKYYQCYSRCR